MAGASARLQARQKGPAEPGLQLAQEQRRQIVSPGMDRRHPDIDRGHRPPLRVQQRHRDGAQAKLKALFSNGSVTAGNASGVKDGAAALILADAPTAAKFGLTPIARILGGATAGVPPRIMGIGPAPASQKLLARLGHPLGMSGARITGIAALELQLAGGRRPLSTMCIGVGQGIAIALERV